jgi:hypothetical protein
MKSQNTSAPGGIVATRFCDECGAHVIDEECNA